MTKTNRSLRSLLTGLLIGVVIGAGLALPMSTGADSNPAACDRIGPSVVWINRGSQSISYDLALTHAPKAFWPAGLDPRDPDTPTSTNTAESGELGVSGLPVGLVRFGTLLDNGDTCVWRTFEVFLNGQRQRQGPQAGDDPHRRPRRCRNARCPSLRPSPRRPSRPDGKATT